ncbi:hypothetical protein [Roseateles sp. L2-2]|uniref:hypothetical protein n=1 Tax=Roseateles sp. L2-2 TaxID=3422597 RepID=UPI003D3698C1
MKIAALALMLPLTAAFATPDPVLACGLGGEAERIAYVDTLKLYQKASPLTDDEETAVLRGLQRAVQHRCSRAATVLFFIKLSALSDPPGDAAVEELHGLIQEANALDEGWLEAGNLYLLKSTRYYAPDTALAALKRAADKGDLNAMELLIQWYDGTLASGKPDPEQAEFWRSAARKGLRGVDVRSAGQICAEAWAAYRNGLAALDRKDVQAASRILDRGLEILGDAYFHDDLIDDTGMSLVLAQSEEKRGRLDVAANIKSRVLGSRLAAFREKNECSDKPKAQ